MKSRFAGFAARTLVALIVALPAFAASTSSSPAPTFSLPARGGQTINLAQYKGQVVLLNFWATWCGPCRQEMPLLEGIHKKYSKLGFTVLGVNVEPDSKAAEAWLSKQPPVTFPILFDTDSKVSELYRVNSMPSTAIIDKKGQVRLLHRGYKPGDENAYLDSIRTLIREP